MNQNKIENFILKCSKKKRTNTRSVSRILGVTDRS